MERTIETRSKIMNTILMVTTFVLLASAVTGPGQAAAGSPAGTPSTAPAAGKVVQQPARPGSVAGTPPTGIVTNTGVPVFAAPAAPVAPTRPIPPMPPSRNGVQPVQTPPPMNGGIAVPATNNFTPPMNNFAPATNNFIPPIHDGNFGVPPGGTIQSRPLSNGFLPGPPGTGTNGFLPSRPGTGTNGFLPSKPGTGTNGFLPLPPGTDTNGFLPSPQGAGTNGFLPTPGMRTSGATNPGMMNQ
jgi:hypothetical protein